MMAFQCGQHPTGVSATVLGTTPPGAAAGLGTTLADGDLPSVMTCANYLKLPPYSCKVAFCNFLTFWLPVLYFLEFCHNVVLDVVQEVMRERLLYAICEGQGSFDLS